MNEKEIKEGMYVKYTRGLINGYVPPRIEKITDCSDNDLIKLDNNQIIINNDVKKASYNIIDLIEVGDYVNGYKVYEADKVCHRITLNGSDDGNEFRLTYLRPALGKNMGIKSIVTKEQFDSMKYVVGGKE